MDAVRWNHENEVGNGPQGHLSYQTRFELPDNGSAEFRGNWYAFTVGPIRLISLNNDDVCLQDGAFSAFRRDHVPTYVSNGDNPYINGYSSGAQRAWLEGELARAQQSDDIDWIVVCMHQVAMSSAHFNGADLGIRRQWLPLFEKYGVDLVVAGHEHHFERSFPVRGTLSGSGLLTPAPQSSDPALMDTSNGTVHMIIGGGGHSTPTPVAGFDMPHDGVLITSVGPGSPQTQHPAITTTEPRCERSESAPFATSRPDLAGLHLLDRECPSRPAYAAAATACPGVEPASARPADRAGGTQG